MKSKAEGIPAVRKLRSAGLGYQTNPHSSDAQDIEDRYGDIVENVQGVLNLFADGLYNYHNWLQKSGYASPEADRRSRDKLLRYRKYYLGF